MSTDNRTILNDADANTGWTGDDTAAVVNNAGEFYEGAAALSTQLSDTEEHMYTTQDSVGAGTFNIDLSDSTVYLLVKDNLGEPYANSGVMIVLGDGTDRIGYDVGGNDAIGLLLPTYFQCYKLDVSVFVATPGTSWFQFAGTEANLDQTQITQIGYGSHHLAKAVGSVDNVIMDAISYIANGSYALTINGGTVGTPETMADVQGDDVTNGWGMVANPVGVQYQFFAPTEWGEDAAAADHYFTATNEQWYWLGDNAGGHAVGATHFPFRVIGNATDTGSFVITNVVIVNTGTGAEFDCSSANVDTLEIDGCTMIGLASFDAPASGGTSRFCTNTIIQGCGTVTHGGASMNGCQILESIVAADTGALGYNIAADPDGEMDDMTFTKGAAAHHAIEFGTSAPATMTLRGGTYTGFNAADANNDSTFLFPDTGSDRNWVLNLVGATGNTTFKKVRAGDTVTIVTDPVTTLVNVLDNTGAPLQNARVLVEAGSGAGDLPFQDSVTITRVTTTASVAHTTHGMSNGDKVTIRGADQTEYNGVFTISNVTTNAYDYTVSGTPTTPATGTITATGVVIEGLTDINGQISASASYSVDQPVRYKIRKGTSAPYFKSAPTSGWLTGTIDNADGLTITQQLILDQT